MGKDASQKPAEDIVLLDDVWQEAEGRRRVEDFASIDHGLSVQ